MQSPTNGGTLPDDVGSRIQPSRPGGGGDVTARWLQRGLPFVAPVIVSVVTVLGTTREPFFPQPALRPLQVAGQSVTVLIARWTSLPGDGWSAVLMVAAVLCLVVAAVNHWRNASYSRWVLALLALVVMLGAGRVGSGQLGLPWLIAGFTAIAAAFALAVRGLAREPSPSGRFEPPEPKWDILAGAMVALCAVIAFCGIERETGGGFFSYQTSWNRIFQEIPPRDFLAITTGTTPCSSDSGPYRTMLRACFELFGPTWITVRGVSAAFLVLTLGVLYRFLCRLVSPASAIAGVLLFGTAPTILDFGHAANFIGPSTLMVVLTVAAFHRWVDTNGRRAGAVLGLLLFADLFAYAPLRSLIAFLPVAAVLVLWRRRSESRSRRTHLAWLALPFVTLLVPLALTMLLTGAGGKNLVYGDGEFTPTKGLAYDETAEPGSDQAVVGKLAWAAVDAMRTTTMVRPQESRYLGPVATLTHLHVFFLVLGLAALATRHTWSRSFRLMLAALAASQLASMAMMEPPVPRRMTVYLPAVLLVSVGGFELLVSGQRLARDAVSFPRACGVLAALGIALVTLALGTYPSLVFAPDAAEMSYNPCHHLRHTTERALARGYELVLLRLGETPASAQVECDYHFLDGNWQFYCWRAATEPDRWSEVGLVAVSGRGVVAGTKDGPWGRGQGVTDPIAAADLRARLDPYSVEIVGPDAPVFWIGSPDLFLLADPQTQEGRMWLDELRASPHYQRCESPQTMEPILDMCASADEW